MLNVLCAGVTLFSILQVNSFTGHRNSEFGLYAYVPFSVSTRSVAVVGSTVGVYIAVDGSPSIDHDASDKFVSFNETLVSSDLTVSSLVLPVDPGGSHVVSFHISQQANFDERTLRCLHVRVYVLDCGCGGSSLPYTCRSSAVTAVLQAPGIKSRSPSCGTPGRPSVVGWALCFLTSPPMVGARATLMPPPPVQNHSWLGGSAR